MKLKQILASALALLMLSGALVVPTSAAEFTDVKPGDWSKAAVDYVVEGGIMSGYGDKFGPEDTLNRAMVVQILFNMQKNPSIGAASFSDVENSAWYAKAVKWAASNGVVSGYGDVFKPNNKVTQQEFIQILYNYVGKPAVSKTVSIDPDKADSWAYDALNWALNVEVLGSSVAVAPRRAVTRAQAAWMLKEFLNRPVLVSVEKLSSGSQETGYNGRNLPEYVTITVNGVIESAIEYDYDAKGREIYRVERVDDDEDDEYGEAAWVTEYDDWDNVTRETAYDADGNYLYSFTYAYNRQGLVSQRYDHYEDGSAWQRNYEYDEQGNEVYCLINFYDSEGKFEGKFDSKYTIDMDGARRRLYERYYDENGTLTSEYIYTWDGTLTYFQYDDESSYQVRVPNSDQAIYIGPGYEYDYVGDVGTAGTYTIVAERQDDYGTWWGKLKSGLGWIDLDNVAERAKNQKQVTVERADDRLLKSGNYHSYGEPGEYGMSIVIRAQETLSDVSFYRCDYFTGERTWKWFQLSQLTPSKPIVIHGVFSLDHEAYRLQFKDKNGKQYAYVLSENMGDGGVYICPY